ncbi:MAG: polysaccharide deacetylase family protein [Thermoplasmata archaeon]|nr:polysaccharide deacetylase family protein [Thermoplasmata archaeon]
MKTYLFTVDVEEQSLIKNRLDDDVPNQLIATGMPRVLDLLDKHQIKATFYYTGTNSAQISVGQVELNIFWN